MPPVQEPGERAISRMLVDLLGIPCAGLAEDPVSARAFLGGYLEMVHTVVARHGGTVEEVVGAAVTASWGTTAPSEEDGERAVRAGLELVAQVAAYGAASGEEGLAARVGVATGPESAAEMAARLGRVHAAAGPGAVGVDAATREASGGGVAYAPASARGRRGRSAPVVVWRALRVLGRTGGRGRTGALEAPLTGRQREVAALKDLFHTTAEGRRAHLVSVTGSAGVGKSRLVWELEKYLDGVAETVWWHRGRCLAAGEGGALWPLATMMRQRLGIAATASADAAAAQVTTGLATLGLSGREVEGLAGSLELLLGVDGAPELPGAALATGWRQFLARLAETAPVVLVLEDAQWADPAMLDFIEHLLDWAADVPLFIVTLARPELLLHRPGWGRGRHNATTLTLQPLSADAIGGLTDDLVSGLGPPERAQVQAAARGLPVYPLELALLLAVRAGGLGEGEVQAPVDGSGAVVVPPTLSDLFTARLDAMSPAARRLGSRLAVFSGPIAPRAAAALGGTTPAELELSLAELCRAQVLRRLTDPLAPEEGQYVFTSDPLRVAAYHRLRRPERLAMHLAAARHLEEVFPEPGAEAVEGIAAHLQAAHEVARPAARTAALRTRLAAAMGRVGARASAVGAPVAALAAYRVALALDPGSDAAGTWRDGAALAATAAGEHQTVLALTERPGPGPAAPTATVVRCRSLAALGRVGEAVREIDRAVEADPVQAAPTGRARLRAEQALLRLRAGDAAGAREAVRAGAVLGEAADDPVALLRGAAVRSELLIQEGRPLEALQRLRWCLELAAQTGDPHEEVAARGKLGDVAAQYDRPEALQHLVAAIAGARRVGDWRMLVNGVGNLMSLRMLRGEWEGVARLAAHLLDEAPAPLHPSDAALVHTRLAILGAWLGDADAAGDHLPSLAVWAESDDVQARALAAGAEGAVLLAAGRWGAALARIEGALADCAGVLPVSHDAVRQLWPDGVEAAIVLQRWEVAERWLAEMRGLSGGMVPPYLRAQSARLWAGLTAAREGDPAAVLLAFDAAVAGFRSLGYPYWRARTEFEQARYLASHGGVVDAAALVGAATAGFTELGAARWAARAAGLLVSAPVATE